MNPLHTVYFIIKAKIIRVITAPTLTQKSGLV